MEPVFDSGSDTPPGSIDKSRVLDVKPLRCLVPVFPNPSGMSSISNPAPTPFVCVSPSGPFPPGVQPFFPFLATHDSQHRGAEQNRPGNFGFDTSSIPAPVPLNSYRTPTPKANGSTARRKKMSRASEVEDDDEYTDSKNQHDSGRRGRPRKKSVEKGEEFPIDSLVNSFLTNFKLMEYDDFRRTTGDRDTVGTVLLVYNFLRKKLYQLEEAKELGRSSAKRPDLKAANLLMSKGIRTNSSKRIGHVPGIEIGDIFFFRMELCLVGLHAPTMAGIDYMGVKITVDEEPVAVSIVSSGGYEDDDGGDGDVLVYTGQGGVQRPDGQMFDQKLERGNLALEKSLHRANEVRVIRGLRDIYHQSGKIYVYDGVYKVQESWAEKNKLGCTVFKYKLVREPGQATAYSVWKLVQQWRDGTTKQTGLILPDLTSGAEGIPVTLVNDIDGEKGPDHFTYVSTLKYSKPFPISNPVLGCHCSGGCQPGDTNCPCNHKNDYLPYSSLGVLLSNKYPIHECGPTCVCPSNCRNRISQAGIRVRLEVFKTKNRGWGLRSWDPIRSGTFICEYAGDVIKVGDFDSGNDDNYIFDATRYYEPLEAVCGDSTDSEKAPFPLVINARYNGNVARFMNHSCSPNVYWQPVLRESNEEAYLHVAFFAIHHIPPMQELTFDYGIVRSEKGDEREKKCLCGSVKCKGFFY